MLWLRLQRSTKTKISNLKYSTIQYKKGQGKNEFDCGKESLNNYLARQLSQDVKKHLSAGFVALDENESNIIGYYTLSSNSIPLELVPEKYRKKYPSTYKNIPTTLLGRLAIDKSQFGKGFGAELLIDALRRSYESSIGQIASVAVIVDPLDEEAENFYNKFGFQKLPDSGKMFLGMKEVSKLFE